MAKAFKPTFQQLALLDWLNERKGCRFVIRISNIGGSGGFDLYETAGRNEETGKLKIKGYSGFASDPESEAITQRLGGSRGNIELTPLTQAGILVTRTSLYDAGNGQNFNSFVSQFDVPVEQWHYNSAYFMMSKKVGEPWWEETGRPLFEQMKAKRIAERDKANRLVLVGRIAPIPPQWPASLIKQLPAGLKFPIPERSGLRPQAYATVVRETEKRLYLEDVHYVREIPQYGHHDASVISGSRANGAFVEREHVIVDNADMAIIKKLTDLDAEYQDDVTRIAVDFAERMLPIMKEMDQRFFQKDNEREMVIGEAIQNFKNENSAGAETNAGTKPSSPKAR